jgi:hypothetical protein
MAFLRSTRVASAASAIQYPLGSVRCGVLVCLFLPSLALGQAVQPTAPTGQAQASAMDAPLQLIAEARQTYQKVTNYTCQFRKRERLHGQLQAENVIAMSVRAKPFSVYMSWQAPAAQLGQEACYVTGANNGMVRVHSTGLLGAVGFVSLDPRDPRCLENSRHAITESGIGNLIERLGKRWELEKRWNRTQVQTAEYDYAKRRCIRVDTTHPDNRDKVFLFYRTVVYFDKETRLPIRVENYDWPRASGDPKGNLMESYSYVDLRFNVALADATFNH